ncbi:FAD-dependent oxidoreductase [Abyssisolibacter fermentans]|uniref:FAD-dependent oxidoreductase n=1 Tax=Abyssisolibacter fermentans TaxID=1766203 RepID=UPI00082C9039|nr:FAD-dependent oxidoreductase [Abyssisolibacter fermentans]
MRIKDIIKTDIAVIGGGPSGIMAAKAAAAEGKRVILFERNGFLGGCATNSLALPLMTFHAGDKQIIKGYAQELMDKIREYNGTLGHIIDPLGVGGTITPIDTEVYKFVTQEYLLEAGVDLKFYSEVIDVEVENDKIFSMLIKVRSGIYQVEAKRYIDASGNGDIAFLSGNPMKVGREKDGKCQPMSMMFKVGNVDIDKVIEYADKNPNEFVIHPQVDSLSKVKRIAVSGFFSIVNNACENGNLKVNRDRVLFFESIKRGEIIVNMSRVIDKIATREFDISEATIEGRRQVFNIMNFFKKYLPGFENAVLLETGCQIGVRETRRIVGDYTLTEFDVVEGRNFDDAVAQGSWPIDIHDPEGKSLDIKGMKWGDYYEIPYRCLLPQNTTNLIVTGRAISATHEAFASVRVSPICMALGQAAGTAAAISLDKNTDFRNVPYNLIYNTLIANNQSIDEKML